MRADDCSHGSPGLSPPSSLAGGGHKKEEPEVRLPAPPKSTMSRTQLLRPRGRPRFQYSTQTVPKNAPGRIPSSAHFGAAARLSGWQLWMLDHSRVAGKPHRPRGTMDLCICVAERCHPNSSRNGSLLRLLRVRKTGRSATCPASCTCYVFDNARASALTKDLRFSCHTTPSVICFA